MNSKNLLKIKNDQKEPIAGHVPLNADEFEEVKQIGGVILHQQVSALVENSTNQKNLSQEKIDEKILESKNGDNLENTSEDGDRDYKILEKNNVKNIEKIDEKNLSDTSSEDLSYIDNLYDMKELKKEMEQQGVMNSEEIFKISREKYKN